MLATIIRWTNVESLPAAVEALTLARVQQSFPNLPGPVVSGVRGVGLKKNITNVPLTR